jgi:hypothetical protein
MSRSFSLTTLLLMMAIVAVWLASIRPAIVQVVNGGVGAVAGSPEPIGMLIVGALAGTVFGVGLAVWNRNGWLRSLAAVVGGTCLGLAAGAQMSLPVSWLVVGIGPAIIVAMVALVMANRRRQALSREGSGIALPAASWPARSAEDRDVSATGWPE